MWFFLFLLHDQEKSINDVHRNALAVDESVNGTIFGCDAASSDWCRLRHFARAGRADCDAGDAGDCRLAVASLAGVYSKRHRVGDELKTNLQKVTGHQVRLGLG